MPEMSWERTAEARAALTAIVSDPEHGVAALSSPRTMSNLLKDLLPDAPREKTVLVAAAEAGLAETLRDHAAQGVDSATAVRLTASQFAANTSFTPEACNWVAGEFAIALGISDRPAAGPAAPPAGQPGYSPGPPQFAPDPAQFAPNPAQFAPNPAQFAPNPAQFASGPAQFAPGQAQYPPGPAQFPPGPVVSPSGPGQFAPGQAQFPAGQPGYSPTFGQPRPKNNNLAITSLICGVAQFVLWIVVVPGVIAALLALIFGLVSIRQMKSTGEAGRGMAVTGVVLGGLGVLGGLIVILLVIVSTTMGTHTQ